MTYEAATQLVRASDALTAPLELVSRRVDGAWVDATRTFPSYHHGNRLFLDSEPDPQRLTALFARYDRLFAWRRTRAPRIISWCAPLERSIAAEFGGTPIDEAVGLLAPRSFPDIPAPAGLTLREYRDARDWQRLLAAELTEYPQFGESFLARRIRTFAALSRAGHGNFYGLEDAGGSLVATAGLFVGNGIARFANVLTVAAYRRRGYARMFMSALLARVPRSVTRTVIVAEAGSAGDALYRGLGFEPFVRISSLRG